MKRKEVYFPSNVKQNHKANFRPWLAHTSACQDGRRGDVMVYRVLKFLSFALLFLFVIFSFSIVVKEFVKCRS